MGTACPHPAVLTDAAESEEQDGGFSLPAPKTDHEAVARTGWHWYRHVGHLYELDGKKNFIMFQTDKPQQKSKSSICVKTKNFLSIKRYL